MENPPKIRIDTCEEEDFVVFFNPASVLEFSNKLSSCQVQSYEAQMNLGKDCNQAMSRQDLTDRDTSYILSEEDQEALPDPSPENLALILSELDTPFFYDGAILRFIVHSNFLCKLKSQFEE